jgi:hypothetical protein
MIVKKILPSAADEGHCCTLIHSALDRPRVCERELGSVVFDDDQTGLEPPSSQAAILEVCKSRDQRSVEKKTR